ncbi:TPA: hypothetical protein ACX6PR_001323 [Photobacterium damselae]
MEDDSTLRELGVDEAKILVNAVAVAGLSLFFGSIATTVATVMAAPVTIPVSLGILIVVNFTVWWIDKETDFEKTLVKAIVDKFD